MRIKTHYDFSMPHLVLYEIYGAHFPHHLDAPLSDLTQEHFPGVEVPLCWENSVVSCCGRVVSIPG